MTFRRERLAVHGLAVVVVDSELPALDHKASQLGIAGLQGHDFPFVLPGVDQRRQDVVRAANLAGFRLADGRRQLCVEPSHLSGRTDVPEYSSRPVAVDQLIL